MESDAGKWLVIYYDRCVPRSPFKKVMTAIGFADHIFTPDIFSEEIIRSDSKLFEAVDEHHRHYFPERVCVFMTIDGKLLEENPQVARHQAFNTSVQFVPLEPCNYGILNWIRAKGAARILFDIHLDRLEMKDERKYTEADLQIRVAAMVRKKFTPSTPEAA